MILMHLRNINPSNIKISKNKLILLQKKLTCYKILIQRYIKVILILRQSLHLILHNLNLKT